MARPIKNNAEYFSHDADMRNDLRIKAIRNKFGLEGYAIYCILLEFITDADGFALKYGVSEIELISADMGITSSYLKKVVDYMLKLNLLQKEITNTKELYIRCHTLEKRFSGLLSKRKRQRYVVIDSDNTQNTELSTSIIHKGKKSKVNNINKPQQNSALEVAEFVAPTFNQVREFFHEAKLYNSNPVNFYQDVKLTPNWKQDAINYANGKR